MKKAVLRPIKDLWNEGWYIDGSDDGQTMRLTKGGRSLVIDSDIAHEEHAVVDFPTIQILVIEAFPDLFTVSNT